MTVQLDPNAKPLTAEELAKLSGTTPEDGEQPVLTEAQQSRDADPAPAALPGLTQSPPG